MAMKSMHPVSETAAWEDQMHADVFDYLHKMPRYIVKKHYEGLMKAASSKCLRFLAILSG